MLDLAQARITGESPGRVIIETQATVSGWLLLSDVWYPGWIATVDGQIAEVLQADYLFRAVSLDAGVHQVVFRYNPLSFRLGFWVSLIAWVGLIGWYTYPVWSSKILRRKPSGGGA